MRVSMFWTAEREATARQLWEAEGRSASEVAKIIGEPCNRNMVCGMAFRRRWVQPPDVVAMRLAVRAANIKRREDTVARRNERQARRAAKRAAKRALAEARTSVRRPLPPAVPADAAPIPFIASRPCHCKWFLGLPFDPVTPDSLVCGAPALPLQHRMGFRPYCATHAALSVSPEAKSKAVRSRRHAEWVSARDYAVEP